MIYRINCSTGFTLLEIMVSLCLLSVILLSIITVFPTGIEAIKMSKNVTIACNIASKHLDQYKSQFYLLPDVETLGNRTLWKRPFFYR